MSPVDRFRNCHLRTPRPGELAQAGLVISRTLRGLRLQMMDKGLARLERTHWRLDRGPRKGRHFASTRTDGCDILVHQDIVLLPPEQLSGILAHELGHATDFLYPAELLVRGDILKIYPTRAELAAWKARSVDACEAFADQLAAAALGRPLGYTGGCQLQTLGKGPPRPPGLR